MSENLKKFLEIVSNDVELAKKLTTTNKEEVEEKIKLAISIAKEKGIELVEKDFFGMTDNDLKSAAGGYEAPNMEAGNNGGNGLIFVVSPFISVVVNTNVNANIESMAQINTAPFAVANTNVSMNTYVNVNANMVD